MNTIYFNVIYSLINEGSYFDTMVQWCIKLVIQARKLIRSFSRENVIYLYIDV